MNQTVCYYKKHHRNSDKTTLMKDASYDDRDWDTAVKLAKWSAAHPGTRDVTRCCAVTWVRGSKGPEVKSKCFKAK